MNYLEALSKYYPDRQAYCTGNVNNYNDIVWNSGAPVSKTELDAKLLEMWKEFKIRQLSEECESVIVAGFSSDAKGYAHWYDSEPVDQINLLGALLTTMPNPLQPDGGTIYYACRDLNETMKEYEPHTFAEITKVVADGAAFKLMNLQKFHTKRVWVLDVATTIAQVQAVTWDSVE